MSTDVACCFDDENLASAQRMMLNKSVRRLPVLQRRTKELVGLISVDDIALVARSRAGMIAQSASHSANDAEAIESGYLPHA